MILFRTSTQFKFARQEVQLPLYYSHFEIAELRWYQHFINIGASFLKSGNKKAFMSHFVLMMRYSLSKSGAIENRGDAI